MTQPVTLSPKPALVLTASAMREADRRTIEEYGIPGFTLMESAGRAAADAIVHRYGPVSGKRVVIVCGKGNNGGDGFVMARVLHARGAAVHVLTIAPDDEHSPDARRNINLLRLEQDHTGNDRLRIHRYRDAAQLREVNAADLYVDALLGTGLTSDLRAPILDLVQWLNERSAPTVAVDLPTGLHSDTGEALGAVVKADLTVTMAALKAGLLLGEGPSAAGHVEVAEIGVPGYYLEAAARAHGGAWLSTDDFVRASLPHRARDAHKYSTGFALVIGGSQGLTGAPTMSSMAAARVGAGVVVCACPSDTQSLLATKLTEIMTLGLPMTDDGGIDTDRALDALRTRFEKASALLIGPGLGRKAGTQEFVRTLLARTDLPVVVDADGLNALQGHTDLIRRHARGRWILTPHAGEFKRLADADTDLTDRIQTAHHYAQAWGVVLILKGMPSVIGCPDGTVYVNGTGNPALATAGTGDVLAGLCVGLLAQGLSPDRAATGALHLGGAAADRYASHRDPRTMLALDLLEELPHVMRERFSFSERG